ncbi:MAG TPA: SprT-like domain-containing protein [Acidobacteriota bacterium]|nr:SprT-like domain-containing protein [Acidobacteriota bacterium]
MRRTKRQLKALAALNHDLFDAAVCTPPASATLYTKIRQEAGQRLDTAALCFDVPRPELPSVPELYRLFDRYNWMYFDGKLPRARIEYSKRMSSAGSYTPEEKLIRMGRKYHGVFPGEVSDTLKHEMIHLLHIQHNDAFKAEAARIGASVRAKAHPSLRKPPRYIYVCRHCGREYPRQRRLRMASCGHCSRAGRFDPRFKLKLKASASRR